MTGEYPEVFQFDTISPSQPTAEDQDSVDPGESRDSGRKYLRNAAAYVAIAATSLTVGLVTGDNSLSPTKVSPTVEGQQPSQNRHPQVFDASPMSREKVVRVVALEHKIKKDRQLHMIYASLISLPQYHWTIQANKANASGVYDRLAHCESGGNWNSYYGGQGIKYWDDWKLAGMPDSPSEAPKYQQIVVAERIRWEISPRGSWRGGSRTHQKWGCAWTLGLP